MISQGNNSEVTDDEEGTSDALFLPKHALPPLDLSFKSLLTAEDIKEEMETHTQNNLKISPTTNKYTCNSIRLNNNSFNDMEGFTEAISEIVENIDDIQWLDLSFNDIGNISNEFFNFNNLKVLYLHGNAIENMQEVRRLTRFPYLTILTMHGNPIETEAGYRQYVLSLLPRLKSLDFSVVTKQDRSTSFVWTQMNAHALKKKRKRITNA